MAVNYEDERFSQVETDKQAAMTELEQTYSGMIGEADQYYQAQIDASKQWADKQSQLQQEQTDFTIEQIEQQKDKTQKDYVKEQSGAYVDYKKQSNKYGAQAEQIAAAGLAGTGFSESSQVSMWNTYQNRVATAREVFSQAILAYDNNIKEARLQNNAVLAEIAFQSLQQQLELSLQGFQYKNQLILDQANKKIELENTYYSRYQDVLEQINYENAFAEEIRQYNQNYEFQQKQHEEEIRQFNESIALQRKQLEEEIRQFNQSYSLQLKQYEESIRQFNEEIARLKKKDEQEYKLQIQQLELEKQKAQEAKRQFEIEMDFKREQLEEQKRQFDTTQAAKSYSSGGGGGGGGGDDYYQLPTKDDEPEAKPQTGNTVTPSVINPQSMAATGLGPRTEENVAELISQGKLTATEKNGQIYVEVNPDYNPLYARIGSGSSTPSSSSSGASANTPYSRLGLRRLDD